MSSIPPNTSRMSESEGSSSLHFMQLPWEIRDMIWSEAWANRKPEVCTHLYTRRPTKGLPGFPSTQLVVDVDLALMHLCRESRVFLTSKAGRVRFRYSLAAKRNVPCRAFDPSLDTLYLGGHNFDDATFNSKFFHRANRFSSHTFSTLPDNEFVDCWQEVENIALEPGVLLPSSHVFPTVDDTRAGIAATFPQLRRLSIVVNPFVDLESSFDGEVAVCAPTRRCRLVEAAGDTTWPGRQPRKHWIDDIREEIELLQAPNQAISFSVQTFEVYVGRQGRKQWKQYPCGSQTIPSALIDEDVDEQ